MSERLEIKAALTVGDTGEITGIAWPFATPDRVGDVIEKGAISAPAKLPMLWSHDQKQVIGVWNSIAETTDGLTVKGKLLVDEVERAREVHAMVRSGAVSGLSIGFVTKSAKPRNRGRTITALDLREISVVAVPSHPGAQIMSLKAAGETAPYSENETMEAEVEVKPEQKADVFIEKKDFDVLKSRLDKLEAKGNRIVVNDTKASDDLEMKAFSALLRTGRVDEIKAAGGTIETKAAATDSDPAGGYLVLPNVDLRIREVLKDLSPMRSLAEVASITTGNTYERFYTLGEGGAQWVSERDDRPQDTDRPAMIKHSFGVSEMYAAPAATHQMLEDSVSDIAGWLIRDATRRFATTEAIAFHKGDGLDGRPTGLQTYPTTNEKDFARAWGKFQYIPAGHASAPTDANLTASLIKLTASLGTQYKGASNATFVMNSNTAVRLRQIVDGNGRYLWAPTGNLIEGIEHPLFGYRVAIDDNMPDIEANAHPIAFGDFAQGYVIVDRQGIRDHGPLIESYEIEGCTYEVRGEEHPIVYVYRKIGGRWVERAAQLGDSTAETVAEWLAHEINSKAA